MARQMTATRNFTLGNRNSSHAPSTETRKWQPQQTKWLSESCLAGKRSERSQPDPSVPQHLHGGHSLQEPDLSLVTSVSSLCLAAELPFCMSFPLETRFSRSTCQLDSQGTLLSVSLLPALLCHICFLTLQPAEGTRPNSGPSHQHSWLKRADRSTGQHSGLPSASLCLQQGQKGCLEPLSPAFCSPCPSFSISIWYCCNRVCPSKRKTMPELAVPSSKLQSLIECPFLRFDILASWKL